MDKLKRYVECYIDTETCNLRCHYCYIAQLNKFNQKIARFQHTPAEIRKALSKKRLGGTCLINMCAGGETLLSPDVIPVVKELLEEGQYVMIVTNGTLTKRFQEIIQLDSKLLERLIFKFSFHYLELIRINMMDQFFENIFTVRNAGCSFTIEITPNDELIPHIEDIKKICMEKLGQYCHFTIARDDRTNGINHLSRLNFDDYKKTWGQFGSQLFEFKTKLFYHKRKEFCYAGDWSIYLNLNTGEMKQCYSGKILDNIYEDLERPLHFEAIGKNCPLAHCYNGHSYLSLGDIKEVGQDVTYASLRNGKTANKEWLNPKMKAFISQKLYDNNEEYSDERKKKINRFHNLRQLKHDTVTQVKKVVKRINGKKNNK